MYLAELVAFSRLLQHKKTHIASTELIVKKKFDDNYIILDDYLFNSFPANQILKHLNKMNDLRVGEFRIHRPLNSGSFGKLFTARRDDEQACDYVVKSASLAHAEATHQMANEVRVYKAFDPIMKCPHFARYYNSGIIESTKDAYIVIERLDLDLNTILESMPIRRFSLKTTLMIAEQMLSALETLHRLGIVHSDLKPNNIMLPRNSREGVQLKLVDFGLSKSFMDSNDASKHAPMHEHCFLRGSARYASLNQHLGLTPSRRDDLESLLYTLIFLVKGSLPWQAVMRPEWTKQQKFEAIVQCKTTTSVSTLCQGLDDAFVVMLTRCREMRYDDAIDFIFMRECIRASCERNNIPHPFDDQFDWSFNSAKNKTSATPLTTSPKQSKASLHRTMQTSGTMNMFATQ